MQGCKVCHSLRQNNAFAHKTLKYLDGERRYIIAPSKLKIGDEITLVTDAGNLVTKIIESIISNTSLQLSAAVGGSDVSTKTVATRNRGKLQDPSKNISIFKLPNDAVKTLKTTTNSGITDTNFKVRRQFVQQLSFFT